MEGITEILDRLGNTVGVVIDWTAESVMPYLIDLMNRWSIYGFITSLIWSLCLLICCVGLGIFTRRVYKRGSENRWRDETDSWTCVIAAVVAVGMFIGAFHSATAAVRWHFIPEVQIIEQLTEFTNN